MKPAYSNGLIGAGIQAPLTRKMHMEEAQVLGLRHLYQLIDLTELGLTAEALPDLLVAAERMGFKGLNITHPFKQSVLPFFACGFRRRLRDRRG